MRFFQLCFIPLLRLSCRKKKYKTLVKSADDLCVKAENTGKLELLSLANANRKRAKEKLTVVQELDKKLEAKLDQLKKA